MPGCSANTKTSREQLVDPLVQALIDWAALIFARSLGLLDVLGVALAALLVLLAGDGRHHFHQHRIDRAKHSIGELITFGVSHTLVAGWKIKRDDAQAFGINRRLELLSILHRKAREAVYRLHQQNVTLARIFEQAQQLSLICRSAAGVLKVHARDHLVVVGGELLRGCPGAAGVLLFGRCTEVCVNEHEVLPVEFACISSGIPF